MNKQQELGITVGSAPRADREMVDGYRFEPIRGQPMLRWAGKRPFTSTQYFPAQEKERHGEEADGWMNELYWGDNLQVMSHLLKKYRGRVNLIYIDPPFDSKADYKKTITLRGQKVENDHNSFEEKQYTDIWTNDEYLQFMYERLILCRELLAENGCIYLHCDWHMNHYLRCILDEIFGYGNCINEVVWCYQVSAAAKMAALPVSAAAKMAAFPVSAAAKMAAFPVSGAAKMAAFPVICQRHFPENPFPFLR